MQMVTHHVLPLALPGMLTGTIIGMARALGETAPLLMIGMVAFIVDIPGGFTDPSTVLPVQIYLWADSPERAFVERTSAAIMVLLAFLICHERLAVIFCAKSSNGAGKMALAFKTDYLAPKRRFGHGAMLPLNSLTGAGLNGFPD
jgi:ABC-type phosphate transport system permease subunit